MNRAALILAGVVIAAACVVAGLALWDTTVPSNLPLDTKAAVGTFDQPAREEAESFEALLRWLFIGSQVVLVATLVVYLRKGHVFLKESAAGPVGTGLLMGMMGISIVWLVSVPFGLVEIWWTRKHDAVDVTYVDYLFGSFFGLGGEALSLCVTLAVVMGLARLLKSTWWLPGVAALAGVVALLAWLSPYLIPDLRQPSPEVKADARPLAKKQGVKGVPVRIENVREYTEQPNAYAMGIGGTRRVVLWDTLAEDFERPEVRSVLSHEFGHLQHKHIQKSIGWFAVTALPIAFLVMLLTRRRGGLGDPRAVPLALLLVIVFQLVESPITSGSSRRYEAEADWAALEATRDADSMVALHHDFTLQALSDPDPPGWYHWLFDSHPSGAERVAMAKAWQWYDIRREK
ncbi:MAG TPA: M48 family metalloprotease [Solirubrobacteraceae bacterium]